MRQVTERLAAVKVESITQGLEKDIIAALEETIAAWKRQPRIWKRNARPAASNRPPASRTTWRWSISSRS